MALATTQITETQIDSSSTASSYVRHTYYGTSQDDDAIDTIRKKYGLGSDSEAIRFALRLVANGIVQISIDGHSLPIGYQAR